MYEYRPELRVKWLFSILDYQHFTLIVDGQEAGHLVVNPVDRDIHLRSHDDGELMDHRPYFTSYGKFERWYRFHRELS